MEKIQCEKQIHGGDIYTDGILKGVRLIDFSSNINPLGVPDSFKKNIQEGIDKVIRYPDIKYRELIKNLIKYLKCTKFLDHDSFLLGNGAAEVIDLAISNLKSILIIAPSFGEYEKNAKKWGCKIEYSYLKENMEYDYEDILCKIKNVQGIIIGNPNNPNGNVIDKAKFKPILEYCEKNNKKIIIDEAFVEFTCDKNISFLEKTKDYRCVFIIRALTKFFAMPGIRFGYGFSKDKDFICELKEKQNPWNINCFAEVGVKYVLFDEKYIDLSNKWIISERKFMYENLKDISFIQNVYETRSNFILCKLKNITSERLYELCKKQNIIIRKGDSFRGIIKDFVRFAIKDRKLNSILLNVLKNIESVEDI